jgi:(E)-4-hydroxy-3-methylbut-2-enyl-diphosphate synthase
MLAKLNTNYCESFNSYRRWKTHEIKIGQLTIGGNAPIRLQSMSSCNPMDTNANVEQAIRIIEAGGELVRFTAPAVKDAENLGNISKSLRERGFATPLVADIHFNPKAAMSAADYVEKVRINPGNYAEMSKSKINYTEVEYQQALEAIEVKFVALMDKCKVNGVAIRIGSNHGSLSQRVMDRFGDTPEGMVEAAMEYLRMAVKHQFNEVVLSMKASNIRVMVQAYRLLVIRMKQENMNFPLHLGVTEAGEGEDGRIKSAAGIGALLEDGLGDTIRVSLTEDPEFEIPVAKMIADRYQNRSEEILLPLTDLPYNPYAFSQRESKEVLGFGGKNEMPVVGLEWPFNAQIKPHPKQQIVPFSSWRTEAKNATPILNLEEYLTQDNKEMAVFVSVNYADFENNSISALKGNEPIVLVFEEDGEFCVHRFRTMFAMLMQRQLTYPVVLKRNYKAISEHLLQIYAAIDFGALLVDGLGDGIWLQTDLEISQNRINEIALGVLQASRSRISKTDFISCPSCGRTLFNIQEATAKIREKTSHLTGLKIAIMGCIVNGPGEMADADYGYVGAMAERINLYKGKEVVRKGVPESEAVEALIELIKSHGDWVDAE